MKKSLTIPIFILMSTFLSAQSIFELNLQDVQSDQMISLREYKSSKGVVIIFMSSKCPYAKYYESRIQKLVNEFENKGIVFLMVNSNISESIDLMKAQANKIDTRYLLDKSKELANQLGAKKSPEVFLIQKNGNTYYSGSIDDNPQVANDVQNHFLKDAINGLLEGKSITQSNNRPVGCMIK